MHRQLGPEMQTRAGDLGWERCIPNRMLNTFPFTKRTKMSVKTPE
jgi:hypothetical protein